MILRRCHCNEQGFVCCDVGGSDANASVCKGYASVSYLNPPLIIEAVGNFSRSVKQLRQDKLSLFAQRLELQSLGVLYVLLLRWAEMRAYAAEAHAVWPVSENKAEALAQFVSIYRANNLDHGIYDGANDGEDWSINEHLTPPQLACFERDVMNGTCTV
eukprot:SAG31_NODE_90_length_26410_cov_175.663981_10_plen_159_part_00